MTEKRKHRPTMNGAAARLLKLRVRAESHKRLAVELYSGLDAIRSALQALKRADVDMQVGALETAMKIVQALHDSLFEHEMEIKGDEQLAQHDSWRILMEYDAPFATEFLRLIELPVLREAVLNLDKARLNELAGVFCDEAE